LPKVDDGTNLWAWMKFLSADSKEELDMLVADKPQTKIGKAVVRLEELSQDEKARMLFESRQMLEWDIKLEKEAEIKSSVNKTLNTVATNLLSAGDSIDKVVAITGLSHDEVNVLAS